jgi:uncharacterized membrane protein SirB2
VIMVLVVIHVLSAVLGLGPAFAFPLLLKKPSTLEEMGNHLRQVARLELFPKVFGSIALLSGLALFFAGSYGPFTQVWILGTLAVYVVIQIVIIGFLNPAAVKLERTFQEKSARMVPDSVQLGMYALVRNLHTWACALSLVIFVLMIVKP